MKSHLLFICILVAYFVIGTTYILTNPLWEAPDELHHYAMIQYLQTNQFQLPSQEIGIVGLWQQEGNQPPLYYFLGALLTLPIDTSNINEVIRINPHADIGIIHPDGNVNRIVHHPEHEIFIGEGAVLASYLLRFFSLILGSLTVWVTYELARTILPDLPVIAIVATAINAFIPMYIYISASINNDNLSNFLANLLVLLLVRILLEPDQINWKTYAIIGIVTGAGLLAKLNIGLFIPIIALVLLYISVRERDWKPFIIGSIISGSLTILIAGGWYWRNAILFADPTGLERFLDIVGRRANPATLEQLWAERESFTRTFWGLFGSINVPMRDTFYTVFNLIGGISLIIGTVTIFGEGLRKKQNVATLLIVGWSIIVFVALLRWTSITPASQGRLVYGAISSITLLMACGIAYWIPKIIRPQLLTGLVLILAVVAALQPFVTIEPAYARPDDLGACDTNCETNTVFSSNDGQIAVFDTQLITEQSTPNNYIQFDIDFGIVDNLDDDWSIFTHTISPDGIILAQRDVYPGGGLLATSDIETGYSWRNNIAIYLPPTTFAPTSLEIRLGWYHHQTGERMILSNGDETISIGFVEVHPAEFSVNFGNAIELIDYDISSLVASDNTTVELTLYWRGLQAMTEDYVIFANIIDPQTLTKYADSNAMPANWTRPTSSWQVGEIIEDTHILNISPDAATGVHQLEVGVYLQEDGFPRLPVIGTYNDFIYLTPFHIENE